MAQVALHDMNGADSPGELDSFGGGAADFVYAAHVLRQQFFAAA